MKFQTYKIYKVTFSIIITIYFVYFKLLIILLGLLFKELFKLLLVWLLFFIFELLIQNINYFKFVLVNFVFSVFIDLGFKIS